MGSAKRWYIYVTSAVSLHAVTWAVITLLRNLLVGSIRADVEEFAYQIAVILVGFPIYLAHWLWAQRLARSNKEELGSFQRCLYLYLVMAGVLGPILNNFFHLFVDPDIFTNLIPIVVLAIVYTYHHMVLNNDTKDLDGRVGSPSVRRLYVIGFASTGLVMTIMAAYTILHWLFYQLGSQLVRPGYIVGVGTEIVRLLVGVIVWSIFWLWLQRLFKASEEEQHSTARRVYLYLIVFISVLTTVATIAGILESLFKRVLSVQGASSGDIRDALPVLIVMGASWAFHALIIRNDDGAVGTVPNQEGIRRAYLYLVAAIGFAALIIGFGGVLNYIIKALSIRYIGNEFIKESLSYYLAAIVSGIPTWYLPWRLLQAEAGEEGAVESRRSIARRIYLYFYLFVSVMTLLWSLISVVYQILLLILGQRTSTGLVGDLSEMFSGAVIAGAVLAFHGSILKADGRLMDKEKKTRLTEIRIAIVDSGEGKFGAALKEALVDEFPGLEPAAIGLTKNAREVMGTKLEEKDIPHYLSDTRLIVGPWNAIAGLEEGIQKIAQAVLDSPAQKLLLPTRSPGFDWIGLGKLEEETLVPKTVKAVKQIMAGEEVITSRPMGCAAILGTVIGLLAVLGLAAAVISFFYY